MLVRTSPRGKFTDAAVPWHEHIGHELFKPPQEYVLLTREYRLPFRRDDTNRDNIQASAILPCQCQDLHASICPYLLTES